MSRDQKEGRREVWYELTEKGRDLAPVIEALLMWGLKHERNPLGADESAHPEHLVAGISVALNELAPKPARPRAWRFEFGDAGGSFVLVFDGERWSPDVAERSADVVVGTSPRALAEFVTRPPSKRRLPTPEIALSGEADRIAEFVQAFSAAPSDRR